MLERDDQDLAVEQLRPAGRADDRQLTLALDHTHEPVQEHAALRAEPDTPLMGVSRFGSSANASSSSPRNTRRCRARSSGSSTRRTPEW